MIALIISFSFILIMLGIYLYLKNKNTISTLILLKGLINSYMSDDKKENLNLIIDDLINKLSKL